MDIELKEEYRNIDIEDCDFSNRTHNILLRSQITNVYELAEKYLTLYKKEKSELQGLSQAIRIPG
jgi:hypothetical protein